MSPTMEQEPAKEIVAKKATPPVDKLTSATADLAKTLRSSSIDPKQQEVEQARRELAAVLAEGEEIYEELRDLSIQYRTKLEDVLRLVRSQNLLRWPELDRAVPELERLAREAQGLIEGGMRILGGHTQRVRALTYADITALNAVSGKRGKQDDIVREVDNLRPIPERVRRMMVEVEKVLDRVNDITRTHKPTRQFLGPDPAVDNPPRRHQSHADNGVDYE